MNPHWSDHVHSIEHADLEDPIWVTKDGEVIDGMHRLAKALLVGAGTIKVKIFKHLPEDTVIP